MSRRLLTQQISPRRFIPEGIYPALNDARFICVSTTTGANDFLGELDQLQFVRFTVVATTTIKGIECVCNTAGGGSAVVRMGIYNSLDNGAPGALIVDGGTVSVTTTGTKAVVINETLVPGAYYVALVAQNWTTTKPAFRGHLDGPSNINVPIPPSQNAFVGRFHGVINNSVSGALPALASPPADSNGGRRTPDIALQISV